VSGPTQISPDREPGPDEAPTAALPELTALLEGLDVGVIVHGSKAEILYANDQALTLLGLRNDQVLGVTSLDPSWDIVRPDGTPFPFDERPVSRVLVTGRPERDVVLGVRRGGPDRHWLLAHAIPRTDAEGNIAHVVVTLSDISSERRRMSLLQQINDDLESAVRRRTSELANSLEELRRTTAALEHSRSTLSRVTEAVPGVIYQALRRPDGRFELVFVSSTVRELLGLDLAAVMADPVQLLACIHPEHLAAARRAFETAERELQSFDHELQIRDGDDRWRWVRSRAMPRQCPEGVMWSGVALDATEQHNLAHQVRLTQTREAIGAVTAGIAHNFNNALAALVPNLEECLAAAPDALRGPLQESLQVALSSAALVEQLMVVARGSVTDRTEPVDLAALVRDVADLCRRIFRGRVTVTDLVAVERARVLGEPSSLRQVLLNLCINARDALQDIDGGHVEIALRVINHGHGQGRERRVVVSVRDDGSGMDEPTLRRIGEPFFTTKAPGQGTGLGLATAYAVVRSFGGAITCDSTLGRGTTFTVTLPLLDLGELPVHAPAPPQATVAVVRGRLLIVDDEKLVRSAIRKVLTRRGFIVDEAPDGSEGLARVREATEPYQGVLLDLSMPGISGERVLEQLRLTHPDLPIVILSGFVEDPAKVASANAVLHKPLTSKMLVETLDRVLA
jgi:two-component system cell cycle sensor histidine kinase/response regulator CckA